MTTETTKYEPFEILEIIRANYLQQQQIDDIALKNKELNFETTIEDWRDIGDLQETDELWKYLNYYFRIEIDFEIWKTILEPQEIQTLKELCEFIALKTEKEIVKPLKLFGQECETAGTFRALIARLKNRGIDITEIKPTSKLEPLVMKYNFTLIEEINQMNPNVLPPINYKTNWVYKYGLKIFLLFLLSTFILGYLSNSFAWITGIIAFIGYVMVWFGAKMKPKKASFENIETIGDLVRKIKYGI